MRLSGPMACVLVAAALAPASAQTHKVTTPNRTKPMPAAARPALTSTKALDRLQFSAEQLPAGVRVADAVRAFSAGAQSYFDNPGLLPHLDRPVAKAGQTLEQGGRTLGSVLAFEFGGVVPKDVVRFAKRQVWAEGGRDAQHPEVVLSYGRFLVILSFRDGDPAAVSYRTQVELRLAQLVPRKCASLDGLLASADAARARGDAEAGLSLLRQNVAQLGGSARGQCLLGHFATLSQDWTSAEAAFARAVELQDTCADLMPDALALWAAVNGLAAARLRHGQPDPATLPLLERAVTVARLLDDAALTGQSLYAYARSLARLDRRRESLAALDEAIRLAPERRTMALAEADFSEAREQPEFRRLLGL